LSRAGGFGRREEWLDFPIIGLYLQTHLFHFKKY
jgi:hypothetical protein